MGLSLPPIIVPAIVSLMFKVGVYIYARLSRTHNLQTRLYLFFLFALSFQNVSEIFALYRLNVFGIMASFEAKLFYAASIAAFAPLVHLAITLALDEQHRIRKRLPAFVYACAVVLTYLLFFTPHLVKDFQVLNYGFGQSITRVPGPLYFLFELYSIATFVGALGLAIYGSVKQDTPLKRLKNSVLAIAVFPMATLVVLVLGLLHFGIKLINWSVTFPFAITFFLVVTAYAIYQHRLFDIQFFIPWSKVRKRKTAFYQRIQATVSELANLRSVDEALSRVTDILHCSAALVGGWRPLLAHAGSGSLEMAQFPGERLENIRRIVVANEISDVAPELHRTMKRFGVAAIVPFYPHSKTAASWLLLGDAFSDSVYTPLDFKNVERLFDNLGEFFLDKIAFLRAELSEAQQHTRNAEDRLEMIEKELGEVREENVLLRNYNFRLMRENSHIRNALDSRPAATKLAPALKLIVKSGAESDRSLDERVAHFEARLIRQALKHCDGDISGAAQLLGLDMDTLRDKIKRYDLENGDDGDNQTSS